MSGPAGADHDWRDRFPDLFATTRIDWAGAVVRYTLQPPPEELISRLHLIAVDRTGAVLVCRSDLGWRFLPGGTREPGESLTGLARRELLEEAGATLLDEPMIIGGYVVRSELAEPYRPHLPHPHARWCHALARAEVIGPPTNPDDGETVVEVLALPPADAVRWLGDHDQRQADVVGLAIARGLL